jgi:hypothetical protein
VWLSTACSGQVITIRIVDAKNERPLPKQNVSVSLLYDASEKAPAKYDAQLHLETDVNGAAQFTLPEPAPARVSVGARLTSEHWRCGCAAPVLAVTQELMQKGIVKGSEFDSARHPAKAEPGEIVFIARPFTFFERLMYPLLKE